MPGLTGRLSSVHDQSAPTTQNDVDPRHLLNVGHGQVKIDSPSEADAEDGLVAVKDEIVFTS